jgi:arabinofuranosyltransferase
VQLGDEGPGPNARSFARRLAGSPRVAALGIVAAFSVLFYWSAYVCDDAWISLRVVENAARGLGLRYNGIERVQVYTSPLFTLGMVPVYWIVDGASSLPYPTRMYFAVLAVSYLLSVATVLRVALAGSLPAALLGFALLASSQAFMTFTSSGLETPLLFMLLAFFYADYVRGEPRSLARGLGLMLCAALAVLTRFDAALLLLAPAVHVAGQLIRRFRWRGAAACAWAALPLVAWLGFALVYYGSLFPTPYYAKVMAHVEGAVIREMGGAYLALIAYLDPITLLFIALAVPLVFLGLRPALAMASALAYLAYVYLVGGDFIGWRFAAPPFLISVLVAQHALDQLLPRVAWITAGVAALALLGYGVAVPATPLRAYRDAPTQHNVQFYFRSARLADWQPGRTFPFGAQHGVVDEQDCRGLRRRPPAVMKQGAGLVGYCAGPVAYVLTPSGVTDALLARVSVRVDRPFKPGHAMRAIPAGYESSARLGRNELEDPDLARYYDKVLLLARGPLFSRARWAAIRELNFTDLRRYPGTRIDGKPIQFSGSERAMRTSSPDLLRELHAVRALPPSAPPLAEDAKLGGADYRGVGPDWVVEIGPEWILFEYDAGEQRNVFTLPDPFVDRGRFFVYEGRNAAQVIWISIESRPCLDAASGQSFETTLLVDLDGREFRGCGSRLR